MRRIEPYFPLSHGVPRVDDRRVISGIIFVIRNGLRWRDAPQGLRAAQDDLQPVHPLEPAWACSTGSSPNWPARLASPTADDRRDPSEGPPHRGQPAQKGAVPRRIGRTKGGLNSKLHAVCDGQGRPADPAAQRRPDERLQGRGSDARRPAARQGAARRQRL